jgi:hypothetical protein
MPIASITKLMTAMVVLDSGLPLEEPITIEAADVDTLKGTRSRLKVGMTLTRRELLKLALMASENRAAAALARTRRAFVHEPEGATGNASTRFLDATGLMGTSRPPRTWRSWSTPAISTHSSVNSLPAIPIASHSKPALSPDVAPNRMAWCAVINGTSAYPRPVTSAKLAAAW